MVADNERLSTPSESTGKRGKLELWIPNVIAYRTLSNGSNVLVVCSHERHSALEIFREKVHHY
jgi:hypothetical protein